MNLIKGSICLLAFVFVTNILFGQEHHNRHPKGDHLLEKIERVVELTPEQREQILAIQTEHQAEVKKLRESGEPDRERMHQLREEGRASVDAILTEQQRQQLKTAKQERRDKRKEAHAEKRAHFEAEVLPELKKARATFDQKLSATERQTIEAFKAAYPRPKLSELMKGEKGRSAHHQRPSREALAPVIAIAKAHRHELAEVEKNLSVRLEHETPSRLGEFKAERCERAGGERHTDGHPRNSRFKAVRFLLLAPATEQLNATTEASPLHVYPNPARDQVNVKYAVQTAGAIVVELVDGSGRPIQTLFKGRQPQGEHTLSFDLPQTTDASLLLRVTDSSGVRSQVIRKQ